MEYLPAFARTKSPSFVGKYTILHGAYGYCTLVTCKFHMAPKWPTDPVGAGFEGGPDALLQLAVTW